LKGLQCCYHIWLFHLLLLILEYTYHGMRPIWKSEVAGYIYSNSITCIIHGKVTACFAVLPSFLVTLFSLSKARIYFEVHNRYFWRLFSSSVWAGVLPCIGYILTVQTGQTQRDGHPNCMRSEDISSALLIIYLCHWLVVNFAMMFLFWWYVDLLHDSFPSLDHQLYINRILLPLVFFTSVGLLVILIIVLNVSVSLEVLLFVGYFAHLVDQSLNNFLMYHTIFGHITYLKREEEIQHGLELVRNHSLRDEDNQNIQIGVEMDEFTLGVYWVDLPGIHPIQLTHEIVNQFDLWDWVVDDAYIQRLQRSRHHKYDFGCFGCFGNICKCPHDFLTLLDRHEESKVKSSVQRSRCENQRDRRVPTDQAENSSGIHRLSVEVVLNIPTQNTLIE